MENNKPIYIVFGASGDLSRRYLLPALKNTIDMGFVGEVVPISRKDYSNLKNLVPNNGEKIFYLAIPPLAVIDAVKMIGENFGKDKIKIILEKPFGEDLESARSLVTHVDQYFEEYQIFRADHYLVKQSIQNVVNEKFDKSQVVGIEIIASEKIDIEGRVNFYEQTGALKDFVQSHLLEMAAITLAGSFDVNARYEALRNLEIVCDIDKHECVKRGQYEGYREEVDNPLSITETFVSINLVSNDESWHGVSITLSTGKALAQKETQIIIKYKDGSKKVFDILHEVDAYERVIKAAIDGNHDLFISSNEILESWRILDKIQKKWQNSDGKDIIIYKKGSTIEEVINKTQDNK